MGKPKIKLFLLQVASLLMICACTVPPNGNTLTAIPPITNTIPIPPTGTFQFSTATPLVISATPTEAWTATETLIPTIPYTPTSSVPLVTVSVGTNCREGPGIIYDLLDGLMVGEQAEIVKLAPAGVDYVVIQRPHGPGECWLWLQYATINGDLSQLQIAPIPPTPTATMSPTATDTSTPAETATPTSPFAGNWTMLLATKPFDDVTVTQVGNTIRGSFSSQSTGNVITFNGTLSSDGRTVTGTMTQSSAPTQTPPGPFAWYILDNLDQFNGYGDFGRGPVAWCGYRANQSVPEPCLRGP